MTATRPPRPQALTTACVYLGGILAVHVVTILVLVSGLSSADGQEQVATQVGWFDGGGRSYGEAQALYQLVLTVLAVLAASGVVLAVHTARGHQPSRVLLTAVAAVFLPVGLGGLLGAGVFTAVLGVLGVWFSAQLWTTPARSWFRVLHGRPPLPVRAATAPRDAAVPAARVPAGYQGPPPPAHVSHPGVPHPGALPLGQPLREPLPRPVSIAVWTALVGSIAAVGLSVLMLLTSLVIGDYDTFVDQGGPGSDLVRGREDEFATAMTLLRAVSGVAVVLGTVGLLAAVRVLTTRRSGGTALHALTVVTIVSTVAVAWAFPFALPWTAAAIVSLVNLRKPESKAWFSGT